MDISVRTQNLFIFISLVKLIHSHRKYSRKNFFRWRFPKCKLSKTDFHVSFRASELDWGCVPLGSDSPDFRNTRTGRSTLRGLFHQKKYITKFIAAYASVTISRWVTGRCLMPRAMHCITNHDVWRTTTDLASQSLLPLSLISASVGMANE